MRRIQIKALPDGSGYTTDVVGLGVDPDDGLDLNLVKGRVLAVEDEIAEWILEVRPDVVEEVGAVEGRDDSPQPMHNPEKPSVSKTRGVPVEAEVPKSAPKPRGRKPKAAS